MRQDSGKIKVVLIHDEVPSVDILPPLLNSSDLVRVVGISRRGSDAVSVIRQSTPEVVLLDMDSVSFDPLTILTEIMLGNPIPVLLLSSEDEARSAKSLIALEIGALDMARKPTGIQGLDMVRDDIARKVCSISDAQVLRRNLKEVISILSKKDSDFLRDDAPTPAAVAQKIIIAPPPARKIKSQVVALGISTGGPQALQFVLPRFPKDFPLPILIVQHIAPGFVKLLAERLNEISMINVRVARDRDELEPGVALFAPDGRHLTVDNLDGKPRVRLRLRPANVTLRPSVDMLFQSVAATFGSNCVAVIMTGMGNDGVEGLKEIKARGGKSLAQDEGTCAVYGMPRSAVENGLVDRIAPLERIVDEVVDLMQ